MGSVDVTANDTQVYADGFDAGAASVDVTSNDAQVYLDGFDAGAASVDITSNDNDVYAAAYAAGIAVGEASVVPEDGIGQDDVDAAVAAAEAIAEANAAVAAAQAAAQISALEDQLADILANCGDDGITQIDVDAAYVDGYSAGASSVDITSDNQDIADQAYGFGFQDGFDAGAESVTPEDGIGQADVDAAYAAGAASVECDPNAGYSDGYSDGAASVTPEDGIGQADVDAAFDAGVASVDITSNDDEVYGSAYGDGYGAGVASVDITSDNSSIADEAYLSGYTDGAASVTPEDGIGQADLDALQVLLDEALANSGGGSCEPIYIDLLEGWNIMGYTLPYPQDVAATLSSIVDNVQIVKNNAAAVYWPEYAFNGIGDFIPGQGYQIRMLNALNNYTYPDVGGQRIELSPTVPEWVHDLPILNHPNDIRSLVRVVNMLGQEVDPNTQFKGEILLYLYNDGTTEKRMVE